MGGGYKPIPPNKRRRAHKCAVTATRLAQHYEQFHDKFSPAELGDMERVMEALHQIAEGER